MNKKKPYKSAFIICSFAIILISFGAVYFLSKKQENKNLEKLENSNLALDISSSKAEKKENSNNDNNSSDSESTSTNQIGLKNNDLKIKASQQSGSVFSDSDKNLSSTTANSKSTIPDDKSNSTLKQFNANDFLSYYDNFVYSKTDNSSISPTITGNTQVDTYIQNIAIKRGYKLRPRADESQLVWVDGQRMHTEARDAWLAMKQAALSEGVGLGMISGYRSVVDQRNIFLGQMGNQYTPQQILDGQADGLINSIFNTRSIPGYSKHHSGYTIDITDQAIGSNFTAFKDTQGFTWISKNNYANARKFGFIPSYPDGGSNMGPYPEAWEYVWVGQI